MPQCASPSLALERRRRNVQERRLQAAEGQFRRITNLGTLSCSGTPWARRSAQIRTFSIGAGLADNSSVLNFFMAGPELVRWDLTAVDSNGPFRLTVHHAQGVIIEYFDSSAAALMRQQELEDLLMAARGTRR